MRLRENVPDLIQAHSVAFAPERVAMLSELSVNTSPSAHTWNGSLSPCGSFVSVSPGCRAPRDSAILSVTSPVPSVQFRITVPPTPDRYRPPFPTTYRRLSYPLWL